MSTGPACIDTDCTPRDTPGFLRPPPSSSSDSYFTLRELKHALRCTSRKRSAPGPDGITFQALQNLDTTALPGLLAAVLQYHPTARSSINRVYTIDGSDVTRVRTYTYLGFLLDDRVSWHPAAMMMQLYRGLILSRLQYALPLVRTSNTQSSAIETLQRVSARLCLGLPRYSPNTPTLVEARVNLVENHGRELTLSSASLLHRLRTGCAFTAKALHRINSAVDPHCPTCDVPEDFDHLLWDCPTLTKERKSLFDGLQYAG
ncbi:hypothetical protein HPB47_025545, partial [Ixodes persulcatus]